MSRLRVMVIVAGIQRTITNYHQSCRAARAVSGYHFAIMRFLHCHRHQEDTSLKAASVQVFAIIFAMVLAMNQHQFRCQLGTSSEFVVIFHHRLKIFASQKRHQISLSLAASMCRGQGCSSSSLRPNPWPSPERESC
jgi:hypothetical protein